MNPPPEDNDTGLPVFRTWRAVYGLVLGCFVIVVIVLTVFSHYFA